MTIFFLGTAMIEVHGGASATAAGGGIWMAGSSQYASGTWKNRRREQVAPEY